MSERSLRVKVYVDGGARGNPGPAGAGVVICDKADGQALLERGIYLGRATNNVAEYRGLLAGLEMALTLGAAEAEVFSDSQLMVRQMKGVYRVRNEGLRPLHEEANILAGRLRKFSITHVRREKNTQADKLVNMAIDLKRTVECLDAQ